MKRETKKISFREAITKYLLLIATIGVAIAFGIAEPRFFKVTNLLDIVRSASIIGIMGIGLTVVQAAGEYDFALGAESAIGGISFAVLLANAVHNIWLGVLIVIGVALVIGFVNSFTVLKIKMPAFIATLGLSTTLTGICKILTGGATFASAAWPDNFIIFGQGFLFGILPMPAVIFVLIILIVWFFMERTKQGRYIYAVGLNPTASTHIGINVKRQKAIAFVVCALLCGIAGMVQASMLNSVTPEMGSGNLLPAISTCMLGATFLKPGVYNVLGTAVGAILLAVITNGLTMIGASFYMKDVIQGLVLLFAVGIIAVIRKGGLASVNM